MPLSFSKSKRSIDWRWQLASAIVDNRARPIEDELVTAAARYIDWSATGVNSDELSELQQLVARAHEIHMSGEIDRAVIEARLLAGQPHASVAKQAGVDTHVIVVYECLFFDFRDNAEYGDWIEKHAIWNDKRSLGQDTLGIVLRHYGYFSRKTKRIVEEAITAVLDPSAQKKLRAIAQEQATSGEAVFEALEPILSTSATATSCDGRPSTLNGNQKFREETPNDR